MDITQRISRNLSDWMEGHRTLGTLKQVAKASKVGFGTVQRAKNGDGNITVQNLEAIAQAFGRQATDLLIDPEAQTGAGAATADARVPDRLATLSDAQLDKLLAALNLLDSWAADSAPAPKKAGRTKAGWDAVPIDGPDCRPKEAAGQ